jgi:hypothetical protein
MGLGQFELNQIRDDLLTQSRISNNSRVPTVVGNTIFTTISYGNIRAQQVIISIISLCGTITKNMHSYGFTLIFFVSDRTIIRFILLCWCFIRLIKLPLSFSGIRITRCRGRCNRLGLGRGYGLGIFQKWVRNIRLSIEKK